MTRAGAISATSYGLTDFVEKGFVKSENTDKYPRKEQHGNLLIPGEFRNRLRPAHMLIERKCEEFEVQTAEIKALEKAIMLAVKATPAPESIRGE